MSLAHAINGVFSVYKPRGWTSRKATDFVQFALSNELWAGKTTPLRRRDRVKIGHGGTLDPMAEGVLVLGVGKGCKELFKYLEGTKEYEVTAKFGEGTDTYDAEGTVNKRGNTEHITQELIMKTLPSFRGNITQVPPIYSALKVNGKRLYDYARQDIALPEPIKPRNVLIKELELTTFDDRNYECQLHVVCGGGTYMRSLVHDMAISLGTYGHMTALKRTRQGNYHEKDTLSLDDTFTVQKVLEKLHNKG